MTVRFVNVELQKMASISFQCELIGRELVLDVRTNGSVTLAFTKNGHYVKEITINSSSDCGRLFKKSVICYSNDQDISYIISFTDPEILLNFMSALANISRNQSNVLACASVFDKRTDSWSAVQYFQFYSYLSQQQNMMQDYIRTSTYQRAILSNATKDFSGKVVLDVGAGSGILSFFAVQAGAKRVYAVEASNMAAHCQTLVKSNKLAGRIVVISGKIEDIQLPEPVDVIISEPMGYMLYNERMLETYVHARKFLAPQHRIRAKMGVCENGNHDLEMKDVSLDNKELNDDMDFCADPKPGIMFPSVGKMFIAPFSDEALFAEQYTKANFWYQQSFHGMDLSALRGAAIQEYFNQPVVDTFDISICPVTEPCVHVVDFRTVKESNLANIDIQLRFNINQCSTIHGLAFWFDVGFLGSQRDVWLSTAPTEPLTHWYQVRCLLGTALFVQEGQILTGHVKMIANSRQSYDVEVELIVPDSDTKITNHLDLKNPHFRYNGYPPVPQPGSHSKCPTEVYFANQAAVTQAVAVVGPPQVQPTVVTADLSSTARGGFITNPIFPPTTAEAGSSLITAGVLQPTCPVGGTITASAAAGDVFTNGCWPGIVASNNAVQIGQFQNAIPSSNSVSYDYHLSIS